MVFVPTGFDGSQSWRSGPTAKGTWRNPRRVARDAGRSEKPSILLVDDLIFMVNDGGIVSAVDPKTGEVVWRGRIDGTYSASPIAAGDRIYAFSEDGKTTVLEASRELKVLARATSTTDSWHRRRSTGARSTCGRTHLYRIEE